MADETFATDSRPVCLISRKYRRNHDVTSACVIYEVVAWMGSSEDGVFTFEISVCRELRREPQELELISIMKFDVTRKLTFTRDQADASYLFTIRLVSFSRRLFAFLLRKTTIFVGDVIFKHAIVTPLIFLDFRPILTFPWMILSANVAPARATAPRSVEVSMG